MQYPNINRTAQIAYGTEELNAIMRKILESSNIPVNIDEVIIFAAYFIELIEQIIANGYNDINSLNESVIRNAAIRLGTDYDQITNFREIMSVISLKPLQYLISIYDQLKLYKNSRWKFEQHSELWLIFRTGNF